MHKTHAQDACIRRMHDAILLRPLSLQQSAPLNFGPTYGEKRILEDQPIEERLYFVWQS
jgi:hypothetical protein